MRSVIFQLQISLLIGLCLSPMALASTNRGVKPQPLDGVYLEAVETYLLPGNNQLSLGVGYWPTNAFYNGFGLNFNYQYQFNRKWAWEVLKGSFLITVDKDLTNTLAEDFGVAPRQIDRLSYAGSSNLVYYNSYGKFIFGDEHVRYFRMGLFVGAGVISTKENAEFAPSLGAKMEVYGSTGFSWVLGLQNYISFENNFENVLSVEISTAYSF